MHFTKAIVVALASAGVLAHPGHDHTNEIAQRREFFQGKPRDLSHCAGKMKRSGLNMRAAQRRARRMLALTAKKFYNMQAMKSKVPWGNTIFYRL